MTTTALRASNLTLLAAFPSAESPHFERCGQGCRAQSTAQRLVTCGHMYLDQGKACCACSCLQVSHAPAHALTPVLTDSGMQRGSFTSFSCF